VWRSNLLKNQKTKRYGTIQSSKSTELLVIILIAERIGVQMTISGKDIQNETPDNMSALLYP
jgi:hypothetical protein